MLWYSSESLVSTSKFLANIMFLWRSSEHTGCKIQALITHHYRYRTYGTTLPHDDTDMAGHMASHYHMVLQTWHATRHHSHELLQTWHAIWHHPVTLLWIHATYSHATYPIAQKYLLVFQLGKNILNDCFQLLARLGEDEFKLQDLTKI
jgi:hypothetical protein